MERQYDIVTFDCYGTLIDWESGIAGAFATADRDAVLRAYAEVEPVVERERYRPYKDVLTESARRVAEILGWSPKDPSFLAHSLPSWKPFPDTNPALERLKAAGYQLGILSNIDDDLLAATRKHFTVDFDLIVTAQQVQSYKPGHAHFLEAKKKIGDRRWLHAAQSNFHDVAPTNALGIDNAWVNRKSETGAAKPRYEVRDLAGLAELLA